MKENKKKLLIVIASIGVLLGGIALSYAYFNVSGKQDLANTFKSGCLNVNIESESEAISLDKQIPITDIEGLNTKGYTFTIKNTCKKDTNYEVNLESLNETANSLDPNYLKVSLSSDTMDNLISKLGSNEVTEALITGAYASHNLYTGTIKGEETKTFTFREWIDYDATVEQAANKTLTTKINVVARPDLEVNELNIKYKLDSNILTGSLTKDITSTKYCVTESNICTPDKDIEINNNKISIELEENKKEQVVCTKLNDLITICSEPLKVTKADLNILAMYIEENGEYKETNTMPTSGYSINRDKSYCNVNGEKDTNITLETYEGKLLLSNLKKGSSCYLYYDKTIGVNDILAKYTKDTSRNGEITANFTGNTPTTVYSKDDDYGTSYVFAGVNPNNWVKLGNIYFRIIRFNGNGSMRLIYSGSGSAQTSGTGTQIGTKAFNPSYTDNMYVGLQYTSGQVHGTGTNSTILGANNSTDATTLYGWYNNDIKTTYGALIDSAVGFCNDRDNYINDIGTNAGGGTGSTQTYYGSYIRYYKGETYQKSYTPTLKCKNNTDLLKLPVGLITADEYALAGGGTRISNYYNTTFWLHTGQPYWTMSPFNFNGAAWVHFENPTGFLDIGNVTSTYGVRPVINLKSTTTFEDNDADGSSTKPYVLK